jgi:hypothetical protein
VVRVTKVSSTSAGFRLVLLLVVTLLLVSLGGAAYAETSAKAQYGSPTASGEAAIAGSDAGTSGEVASAAGGLEVLPATGGSLLPLVALGVLVLGATGLIALRR